MNMSTDEIIEILSHTADLNDLRAFCNVNNNINQICRTYKITIIKKFLKNKGIQINFKQFTHDAIVKIFKLVNQMHETFGHENTWSEFTHKYNLDSPYATSLFYEMTFLSESLKHEWFKWIKKRSNIIDKKDDNPYNIWNDFVTYYRLHFDENYNERKFTFIKNEIASIAWNLNTDPDLFDTYPIADQIALWYDFMDEDESSESSSE